MRAGILILVQGDLVAQTVKNLHAMQKTCVQFLGREDPLKKGMVTQSSILAWEIPWTEKPGGLLCMGLQRVRYDCVTNIDIYKALRISPEDRKCSINVGLNYNVFQSESF